MSLRALALACLVLALPFIAVAQAPKALSAEALREQCSPAKGMMRGNCNTACAAVSPAAQADCVKDHGGNPALKADAPAAPTALENARGLCGSAPVAQREACAARCANVGKDALNQCVRAHGG